MTRARALLLGLALLPGVPGRAQEPWAEVSLAADLERSGPTALSWLREQVLPTLPGWPRGLEPLGPVALRLSHRGLAAWASDVALGDDYLAGAVHSENGTALLLRCGFDGTEDWYAVEPARLGRWGRELTWLRTEGETETLGRIDVAALVGNLLEDDRPGGTVGLLLSLGPGYCGDLVWRTWRGDSGLRIHARSNGGLLLPALLAIVAVDNAGHTDAPKRWNIVAASSRDGERVEAARQLARTPTAEAVATLRQLLHSDGPSRIIAMDSLVRLGSTESLPHIVSAASSTQPDSVEMARVALRALWPRTSATERADLLHELRRHPTPELRRLGLGGDTPSLDDDGQAGAAASTRARILAGLMVLTVGVLGLWLRERLRV